MFYDQKALAERVKRKQKSFLVRVSVILALMATSVLFIVLNLNSNLTFGSILAFLILFYPLAKAVKRFRPLTLFSREIRGVNVKEHEVGLQKDPMDRIRRSRRPAMPYTFENFSEPPRRIRGTVYLRTDDGNVKRITGLRLEHMELYRDGDTLFKPGGAAYPQVECRIPEAQPCPLCGTMNKNTDSACHTCGLKIVSN